MNTQVHTHYDSLSNQPVVDIDVITALLSKETQSDCRPTVAAQAVASPIHRAVESMCVRIDDEQGQACHFAKVLHPEMSFWVDSDGAGRAAVLAGEHALGPATRMLPGGALIMPYFDTPWYTGQLNHLANPALLNRVLSAKKRLHTLPTLGVRFSVFDRLSLLSGLIEQAEVPVPTDLDWLLAHTNYARQAIAAIDTDTALCHNDGAASNLLLHPDGGVLLIDFDLAGDNDPWYDIASVMNEACEFPSQWPRLLEPTYGKIDPRVYHRMRLYAACEDLMWGMWGLLLSVISERKQLEFFKYGQWRLLRSRIAIKDWAFEHWLREL